MKPKAKPAKEEQEGFYAIVEAIGGPALLTGELKVPAQTCETYRRYADAERNASAAADELPPGHCYFIVLATAIAVPPRQDR